MVELLLFVRLLVVLLKLNLLAVLPFPNFGKCSLFHSSDLLSPECGSATGGGKFCAECGFRF
jgi:hypothetical protein